MIAAMDTLADKTATASHAGWLPWRRAHRPAGRHSTWTIALHWTSVAAIVLATAVVLARELVEDKAARTVLLELHRQLGLIVLLALAARLAVRVTIGLAETMQGLPWLVRAAAYGAHAAMYGALLALPVLGWATTNAHGVTLKLFGVVPLPRVAIEDPDLADTLSDYHVWAAWALLALVVLHVAAACWHHFVRRDGVLPAMAPWASRRRP
jgi:cytochrome b561